MSMSKNPFINALAASGYISLLATAVFTMPTYVTDNELGMMADPCLAWDGIVSQGCGAILNAAMRGLAGRFGRRRDARAPGSAG